MIFDPSLAEDRLSDSGQDRLPDQAAGLRQLRRHDQPHTTHGVSEFRSSSRPWPRIVLVSEASGTDLGARFAFHLACALQDSCVVSGPGQATQSTWLIDLAPAASRLPHVLADHLQFDSYAALWNPIGSGRMPPATQVAQRPSLVVSAEATLNACALDQLPRLYEQLVRMLSRHGHCYRWIVMLALDTVVPLDGACWQAADDVILLSGPAGDSCQASDHRRLAAMVQSRLPQQNRQRTVWSLSQRPRRSRVSSRTQVAGPAGRWLMSARRWLRGQHTAPGPVGAWAGSTYHAMSGLATKSLPAIGWPKGCDMSTPSQRARVDRFFSGSAIEIAQTLRLAAACQDEDVLVNSSGSSKKIQLSLSSQPITQVTEEFRA